MKVEGAGGTINVREHGHGDRRVVCLHALALSGQFWAPLGTSLAADHDARVLAVDARGHGPGLRADEPFTLAGCASDAAALVRELGCGPVIAVGYSMGGPIAALMARDHPETVAALVQCATAREWKDPRMKALWGGMGALRLWLILFPLQAWRWGLRWAGFPDSQTTSWVAAELSRGSARDIAEAGRELGRFDSRTWIRQLDVPSAVVVTTRDKAVPPRKQYELAESLRAPTFEIACDHSGVTVKGEEFCRVLLRALEHVSQQERAAA
jgi:3-oxoadipate enol-lactonase